MDTSHPSVEEGGSSSSSVENCFASASALSSSFLDLSRRGITKLPQQFPDCRSLECLYLEGNCLHTLPEAFCTSFPNLQWLDLRNNQLTALPGSVENLQSLKTLLLESNSLTHLPPQLGLLSQLVGLNLHGNPLVSPPRQVVERGTKAVLHYLQQLSDTATGAPPIADCDEDTDCTGPRHKDHCCRCTQASPVYPSLARGLPLPLHQPAILHSHSEESQLVRGCVGKQPKDSLSLTPPKRPQQRESKKLSWQRVECLGAKSKVLVEASSQCSPQQLSTAEQCEISNALDRQRSKDYLEKWREETRLLQKQLQPSQQPASVAETAPYATDNTLPASGKEGPAMRGQHEAREAEVSQKMHRCVVSRWEQQQQNCGQAGELSELLEAERRLAETMAERKALEAQKTREYRLTAFTGDLPMGTL